MRNASSDRSSQPRVSGRSSQVTAALVASVTCTPPWAPPESVQATQLSTVPKQSCSPARVRSGSISSRIAASLVADAFRWEAEPVGLHAKAGPHRAQVLPSDSWPDRLTSCAIPHDGGRALVGYAHAVDGTGPLERDATELEHDLREASRVDLNQPGCGGDGRQGLADGMIHRAVWADHSGAHARGAHVDDEDALAHERCTGPGPRGPNEGTRGAPLLTPTASHNPWPAPQRCAQCPTSPPFQQLLVNNNRW